MSLLRAILLGVCLAGAYSACSRVEVVDPSPDVPIGGAGAAGEQQGGSGSLAGESAGGEGSTGTAFGGAPSFVDVALWPTYPASVGSSDTQAVLAAVTALSAGSLTLPVHERWSELTGPMGSPRALAWQRLDALTKPYRERDGHIALCIDIVDRTLATWPLMGELDPELAKGLMERTLDEVFARYSGQLSLVCFGYELDRYFDLVGEKERAQLLAVLQEAVQYASGHSQRGQARVGVAVTLDALLTPDGAVYDELRLGDEVVAVYDPLAGDELKPPYAVADELASALQTIAERDATPRRLALLEAGYPTSAELDSSEALQVAHMDALIGALDAARETVDFVGLYGLYDRAADTCEAEAGLFGTPKDASPEEKKRWLARRSAERCSLGLRAENAAPKEAWQRALSALSRYSP